MALRTVHGRAAEFSDAPVFEVLPIDELPEGIPAEARAESPIDRGDHGRFAPGNTLARAGGLAKRGKVRLANRIGLTELDAGSDFAPYKAAAVTFRRAMCAWFARTVGGGVCGPAPSSYVATAAIQLALSRYLGDKAIRDVGDGKLALVASRLGNDSRSNLSAAHEYCAKEAEAEAKRSAGRGRAKWRVDILGAKEATE